MCHRINAVDERISNSRSSREGLLVLMCLAAIIIVEVMYVSRSGVVVFIDALSSLLLVVPYYFILRTALGLVGDWRLELEPSIARHCTMLEINAGSSVYVQ